MIDYETYVLIRNYFTRDGLKYSQIADELELDHRTVAKWANEERYLPRRSAKRPSKLDPFKNDIVRMLEKHPYSARQIYQRIQQNGFDLIHQEVWEIPVLVHFLKKLVAEDFRIRDFGHHSFSHHVPVFKSHLKRR